MKKISLLVFCLISFTLTASAATLSDALKIKMDPMHQSQIQIQ
jgi:hypothetical protein